MRLSIMKRAKLGTKSLGQTTICSWGVLSSTLWSWCWR